MRLTTAQHDRAAGVLLAQAAGDALGVPYEFATPPRPGELAEMRGGGLGNFAPGEWSDDTAMAIAIADVAATGADLCSADALDGIAEGFLRWYGAYPPDIGIQTRSVLAATRHRLDTDGVHPGQVMAIEAAAYSAQHPRSAGNGALMRTGVVALTHLDDRDHLARAARSVARLTHGDSLAGDSCVLWCEAIRVAVLDARIDVANGLDLLPESRRDQWAAWLADAVEPDSGEVPGARFRPNGFTVSALQAALATVTGTEVADGEDACLHLQHALHNAVRIGDDTDTVAAIAGQLLGARWGASAVPWHWRRAVHGWPGRDGRDLVTLAALTARGGEPDDVGWPTAPDVAYYQRAVSTPVPHPHDDGVLLGTHRSRDHSADAVVALCRVGRDQACFDGATDVVEVRLIDSDDPAANGHLGFVIRDAAKAVKGLRDEGKRVLLHCVAAEQRTPTVAIAYSVLLGHDPLTAAAEVAATLPSTRGSGLLWDEVVGP